MHELTISHGMADIAYILAGSTNEFTTTVLQTLPFNRIPESAALAFFVFGLAGIGFSRRRAWLLSSSGP